MKTHLPLKKILLFAGLFFLLLGINSCSDDDGDTVIDPVPSATITVADDSQIISKNTIVVDKITANTNVWLVAHHTDSSGEIIGQKLITSESAANVELSLNAEELNDGDTVVLMLHVDNGYNSGDENFNETTDTPITGATETVVVNTPAFTIFDATVTDSTLIFENVTVSDTGWIVVYNGDPNEETSEIVGYSLIIGSEDDVTLTLNENYTGGDPLFARLHVEDQDDEDFTFMDDPMTDVPETFGFEDDNTIWRQLTNGEGDAYNFEWYDLNDNGTLDFQEAVETFNFSRYFTEHWDTDGDEHLNKNEFYTSFFISTDYSLNKGISQEEWNNGYSGLFGNWTDDEFSEFDTNKNNVISLNEWINIFNESGWFEAYDINENSVISLEEWYKGLFVDWDLNENSLIDEEEFERYIYYVFSWMRW